ncbi:MAG: tRNA lysidine(34) synthetase TilS [Desulfobacterales bacterium]|nr:tRNA lysidine(34) synthetase TilS [Desulfobacterales bacterium]
MISIAEKTITNYKMIKPYDSILIGVSGGPDSVTLLYFLNQISPKYNLNLAIAHLNHSLRGKESDNEAEFVESLSKKLNLPFYLKKEDVSTYKEKNKLSLEEAGRQIRYEFFLKISNQNGFNKIALGHNLNDNAELILMNLIRGSGILGMSGIPPVRDGIIIRPLIEVKRHQIIEFLKENKLSYVTDISNYDTKFLRNKIRNDLIPLLEAKYNPNTSDSLNRLGLILRAEDEWMDSIIEPLFQGIILSFKKGELIFSLLKFVNYPIAVKRRILRRAISLVKENLRKITHFHIENAIDIIEGPRNKANIDLPDNIKIFKDNQKISLINGNLKQIETKNDFINFEYYIGMPENDGEIIYIRESDIYIKFSIMKWDNNFELLCNNENIAYFDVKNLNFPVCIRNFKDGDRFIPFGMKGSQKLKKFFINNKVSAHKKKTCPILLSGKDIMWVIGYRTSEVFRIKASTQTALKVDIMKKSSN